jgi:hypothetical protein
MDLVIFPRQRKKLIFDKHMVWCGGFSGDFAGAIERKVVHNELGIV